MKLKKVDRQERLLSTIEENPFITDEELSSLFNVSIQTIRLDRLEKSIPEVRERIKNVAAQSYDQSVRSLPIEEIIGEIVDIELDEHALSIFDIQSEHVFSRNQITRGHHLFAQANSLCVALIDATTALTTAAKVQYLRPVKLGERVVSKANVTNKENEKGRTEVTVKSYVGQDLVFTGEFELFRGE